MALRCRSASAARTRSRSITSAGRRPARRGHDESSHCYKRIKEVLRYHGGTIRVLHVLKPIGVAMAPPDEIAPFRDWYSYLEPLMAMGRRV